MDNSQFERPALRCVDWKSMALGKCDQITEVLNVDQSVEDAVIENCQATCGLCPADCELLGKDLCKENTGSVGYCTWSENHCQACVNDETWVTVVQGSPITCEKIAGLTAERRGPNCDGLLQEFTSGVNVIPASSAELVTEIKKKCLQTCGAGCDKVTTMTTTPEPQLDFL